MTEWLVTFKYSNGYTTNAYVQFAYENPTKDEVDALIKKNKVDKSFIDVGCYDIPSVTFMQKLYRR